MEDKQRRRIPREKHHAQGADRGSTSSGENWEKRALARVRSHVRRLRSEGAADPAGWEADTLTRLEDYFGKHDD